MDWVPRWVWMAGAAFVAFVLLVVIVGRWGTWRVQKKLDTIFADREPLSGVGFYEKYFQSRNVPSQVVIKVREILESELGADLSRLSVDDDFTKELGFFWEEDSLADVELVARFEQEFGIKIEDEEAGQMFKSIDTMTATIVRKLPSGQRTESKS